VKLKELSVIVGIITGASAISIGLVQGALALDGRYAKAEEQQKLEKRVTLNELRDLYNQALEDYYDRKKLSKKFPEDDELKEGLEKAKKVVDRIEKQMLALESSKLKEKVEEDDE
jgi:hypothetical protein